MPVVCVLRTREAAWISSANTTTTPFTSPSAPPAATWTAASRFAGPSAPASAGLRIAPVTTTGLAAPRDSDNQ